MVLQISSVDAILKFPVFFMYVYQHPWQKVKKRNFGFELGLRLFDTENIDTGLAEPAKTSFGAIILMVNLTVYQSLPS